MPVLFVGHGSPLYAIEDNEWSRGFRGLAQLVPRPRSVLMRMLHSEQFEQLAFCG